MNHIIPTAEPFFFPGSETGCLLIHGFTGAPKEMRWLGDFLASKGFSVLGIRLSGHATRPEDMIRSRYHDWLASVEDGWHLLSGVAKRIYLVGLSMGGILALHSSINLPASGVVAMSTPYKLPDDWRLKFTREISWFIRYMPKSNDSDDGWYDKEAHKDHVSYPANPVRAIGELNQLLSEMRNRLPDVNVPVLLIHSKDDPYVLPESMPAIYSDLGTKDKTMLWIEKSGHVVTRESKRDLVFRSVAEFISTVDNRANTTKLETAE